MNDYLDFFPSIAVPVIKAIGNVIFYLKPEYYVEVEGMAEALELDPGIVLSLQYIYEFSAFCTSIVVR